MSKYKRTKTQTDLTRYKQLRNHTLTVTRNEKKAYIKYLVNLNDPKGTWRGLKEFNIGHKKDTCLPENISDPDTLNRHFSSLLQDVNSNCDEEIKSYISRGSDNQLNFSFRMITTEEVNNILNNIKTYAFGADNINSRMLKLCSPFIDKYIAQ